MEYSIKSEANPVEIITALSTINPANLKMVVISLGPLDADPETSMHSVTISICHSSDDERKFVACQFGREHAIEQAAKSVYRYLVEQADARLGPKHEKPILETTDVVDSQTESPLNKLEDEALLTPNEETILNVDEQQDTTGKPSDLSDERSVSESKPTLDKAEPKEDFYTGMFVFLF